MASNCADTRLSYSASRAAALSARPFSGTWGTAFMSGGRASSMNASTYSVFASERGFSSSVQALLPCRNARAISAPEA